MFRPVVGKDFQVYDAEFRVDAYLRGVEVPPVNVEFGPVIEAPYENKALQTVAQCEIGGYNTGHRYAHIVVAKSVWERLDKDAREIAFYHEMGHCVLYLGHSKTGIMRPGVDVSDYNATRTRQINELFKKD